MRKLILVLTLLFLVGGAGALIHRTRAQEPAALTIQVNGETVVLKPGENITPEEFALARDPELVARSEWVQVDGYWALIARGVVTPLEARQVILPDGHPEFPLDIVWVTVEDNEGPIEVPVPLDIPASWSGKYQVRVDGNMASFEYALDPDRKETIFSIAARTEAQWEALRAAQSEPNSQFLLSYGGIVYSWQPALDTLYTGPQAEEFSQMVGEAALDIVSSLGFYLGVTVP